MLRRLLDTDPKKRPSTTELLYNLSEDKDVIIAKQNEIIRALELENEKLRDQVNKLEEEIRKVKIQDK